MQAIESWNVSTVLAVALMLVAAAMLVVGLSMTRRLRGQDRSRQVVDQALATGAGRAKAQAAAAPPAEGMQGRLAAATRAADSFGKRLSEGRFAEALLAGEDRKLVDMAGYENPATARLRFIVARFTLALLLPAAAVALDLGRSIGSSLGLFVAAFFGFAIGYMLPKWFVRRRLSRRRKQAANELPLLIDLLRLLQGVGLSIDQSLQVLTKEFDQVLPVLAYELRLASELYVRGRTREQSLARLAAGVDNDDLSAICRLIAQVDQHGGAVQEPLNRFGERLREKRRLELKEKVGKTTVKMTAVMIVTLLPALLIVTGGAGFVAVLRGLSRMGGM
ncbi:type II secretion system F family protein [Achromobacter ruhlandii]|uniref:type II secretion system F family protein n=1 Tax=Achromobacter ruhlandii TaxID=72557 RepID=UPI000C257F3F|nr:type II secretion system F family protein [Achromobacter ruhlandii]PJM90772.1 type II secretion protein F [Achromobacter ruhlandii]